jgi:hypothetical protein
MPERPSIRILQDCGVYGLMTTKSIVSYIHELFYRTLQLQVVVHVVTFLQIISKISPLVDSLCQDQRRILLSEEGRKRASCIIMKSCSLTHDAGHGKLRSHRNGS